MESYACMQDREMFRDGSFSVDILYDRKLPDFLQNVKLKYVKLGYQYLCRHFWAAFFFSLWVAFFLQLSCYVDTKELYQVWEILRLNLISVTLCLWLLIFGFTVYAMSRPECIYLVDFSCYRAPDRLRAPFACFVEHLSLSGNFDEHSVQFQRRILERSGLGDQTALPDALHYLPPRPSMAAALEEAQMVIFGSLEDLFAKTQLQPKDISILVVNCSLFSPTPSLCAMIINKYKMRGNIKSFNLSGMGCSAGLIAIDVAKDLLRVNHNSYALVISTENITQNLYCGNRRSMMIPNCLFRMGGSAVLLSNRMGDKRRSKYELLHVVRTHKGADDKAYTCVYQEQDENGKLGVSLSKDLMTVAGDALKANITTLGPLVLPVLEQLQFLRNLVLRKLVNTETKTYIPDFNLAFDHICIHAGGKTVIDELERHLHLSEEHVEASRMTLHRFGNTSSSSIWYELAYSEGKGRVKRGHRVWQIAFGSGFKCNSAVWRALKTISPQPNTPPWNDSIHLYPLSNGTM